MQRPFLAGQDDPGEWQQKTDADTDDDMLAHRPDQAKLRQDSGTVMQSQRDRPDRGHVDKAHHRQHRRRLLQQAAAAGEHEPRLHAQQRDDRDEKDPQAQQRDQRQVPMRENAGLRAEIVLAITLELGGEAVHGGMTLSVAGRSSSQSRLA